jgi:hypothetical protein
MTTPEQATIKFSVPMPIRRELQALSDASGLSIRDLCRVGTFLVLQPGALANGPTAGGLASLRAQKIVPPDDDDAPAPANGGGE